MSRPTRLRWTLNCAAGEAAGIAVVGPAYAAGAMALVPAGPAILAAGAWEGLTLGAAQAMVLRPIGVRARRWIVATVLVAAAGYGGSFFFAPAGPDPVPPPPDPPILLVLAGFAAMGIALGALMGLAQSFAAAGLPRGRWMLWNAIGWAPAMMAIGLVATVVAPGTPLWLLALYGALAGTVAGACVGLATHRALPEAPL